MSERVVLVDAVRSPFGKAGSLYAETRADDIMVRVIRGLLERNPKVSPAAIDEVAIAAATQSGDQGMNIGRSVSLLAGIPNTVPGYSIDRWCAGALTAVTTVAGAIAMGQYDFAIAGGVSSNSELRQQVGLLNDELDIETYILNNEYCTDNAAMIGITGYYKFINKQFSDLGITPLARMNL